MVDLATARLIERDYPHNDQFRVPSRGSFAQIKVQMCAQVQECGESGSGHLLKVSAMLDKTRLGNTTPTEPAPNKHVQTLITHAD